MNRSTLQHTCGISNCSLYFWYMFHHYATLAEILLKAKKVTVRHNIDRVWSFVHQILPRIKYSSEKNFSSVTVDAVERVPSWLIEKHSITFLLIHALRIHTWPMLTQSTDWLRSTELIKQLAKASANNFITSQLRQLTQEVWCGNKNLSNAARIT